MQRRIPTARILRTAALVIIATGIGAAATAGPAWVAAPKVNYFGIGEAQTARSYVELRTVRADTDAVIEVFSYNAGQKGELIGSQPVHAGVNRNVKIRIRGAHGGPGLAIMRAGDKILAERTVSFE